MSPAIRALANGLTVCALVLANAAGAWAGDRTIGMSGLVQLYHSAPPRAVNTEIHPAVSSVDLSGTGPAAITLGTSDFIDRGTKFRTFPSVASLAQLASTFTHINLAGTLRAGDGPATASVGGTVGYCPAGVGNPPIGPDCLSLGQAAGGHTGLIRVFPTAGKQQFGGTFKILQKRRGALSRFTATPTPQHAHTPFDFSNLYEAGAGLPDTPFTRPQQGGGPPKFTVGAEVHPTLGYIVVPGVTIGTGIAPVVDSPLGLALTTGRVTAMDLTPVTATQSTSGFDTRTPSGAGVIQLVSGSIVNQNSVGLAFQNMLRLRLTLPEPGPTAGLLAGLGALVGLARMRAKQR